MTSSLFRRMRPHGIYEKILEQRKKDGLRFFRLFGKEFIGIDCPACKGKSDFSFMKHGYRHYTCKKCGTLYCSPRPTEYHLEHYYNNFAAPKAWTRLLIRTEPVRKSLQYAGRAKSLVQSLRENGMRKGGSVVDVGSGSGAFLMALKRTCFFKKLIALDLSRECVDLCRRLGFDSRAGSLSVLSDRTLDLITTNDLIEHLFDPLGFLNDCRRVLRKNGWLAIATPNGEGFDFKIMKSQTRNIVPPEHLNYFNPRSIRILLRRAGFDPVVVETPGKLDVAIIENEMAKGFPVRQKNEYIAYLLKDCSATAKENFQSFLSRNGLSSHMLVLARRKDR